jgi:hypothetical protein
MATKAHVIEQIGAKGVHRPETIRHGLATIRFDRAGLKTVAGRDGDRLSIQSDPGTSDTHTVGIHVGGLSATLIYTDTHPSRAAFVHQVLEPFEGPCKTKPAAADGRHEIRVGRFTSQTQSDLEQYSTFVGSRLVFLIDRNGARKRLERFIKRADAVVLLKWTSDDNIGQCVFLQAGDIHLICTALEHPAPSQPRLGIRLDELLGRDSARAFLMTALAIVSAGLTNHQPLRLINDEIEAALLNYLETTDQTMLTAASDHAMLVSVLLNRIRGALIRLKGEGAGDDAIRSAQVTQAWEKRAVEIARRSSRLLEQTHDNHDLRRLLTEAGAVAEALEQAAFKLTFTPKQTSPKDLALVDNFADLVSQSAGEYVHCLEDARDIRRAPTPTRGDLERFLATVDRLADLEHRSNAIARLIEATLMQSGADMQPLHVLPEVARAFQQAIESLARCSLIVRDYVFSTTSGGK